METDPAMEAVQAGLAMPGATVRIIRYVLSEPVDTVLAQADAYRLNLCLTPRPLQSRACFADAWGPHRFEPLGDVFLAPPGHAMHMRSESGRQMALVCAIDRAMVEQWLDGNIVWTDRRLLASLNVPDPHIRTLLARLADEAHRPGLASGELTRMAVGQLAIDVARFCAAIADGPATGGLSAWRLRLIDDRLRSVREAPSLGVLADLCGLSIRQLTRGFRASRGCSIADYIARIRIEEAKRLLAGADSIKTIAFAMGFASPSAFAFAFRRAAGVSPRHFRQRMARAAG